MIERYTNDDPELEREQGWYAVLTTVSAIFLTLYIVYMENEEAITSFLRG
jgi:hypothetical protein